MIDRMLIQRLLAGLLLTILLLAEVGFSRHAFAQG